jgi:hypothetical protein
VSRVYGDVTEIENFEATYFKPEASVPFSIIHNRLVELFNVTGNGSEVVKEKLISDLLSLCSSPQEVKYLVRFLNVFILFTLEKYENRFKYKKCFWVIG